jgi:hypothetical protein
MTPSLIDISVPGLTDRMATDLWCTMLSERQVFAILSNNRGMGRRGSHDQLMNE